MMLSSTMRLQGELRSLVTGVRGLAIAPREAPKRPVVPWVTFVTNQMPKYKKTFPDVMHKEIMGKMSAEWKKLPISKKAPMEKAYEQKKAEWQKAMGALPEEVKMDLLADKRAKTRTKQLRNATSELKVFISTDAFR
jgi:hypothetical protein